MRPPRGVPIRFVLPEADARPEDLEAGGPELGYHGGALAPYDAMMRPGGAWVGLVSWVLMACNQRLTASELGPRPVVPPASSSDAVPMASAPMASGPDAGPGDPLAAPASDAAVPSAVERSPVPLPNIDRAIQALRPRIRRCLGADLEVGAPVPSKVVITAQVSPAGKVLRADASSPGSPSALSVAAKACIEDVVRQARFEPPGAEGTTLTLTMFIHGQGP